MPTPDPDFSTSVPVSFISTEDRRVAGSGVLTSMPAGQLRLETDVEFPFTQSRTVNTSIKRIAGASGEIEFSAVGRLGWTGGVQWLEILELHWGAASLELPYTEVEARFQNLAALNSYRVEDGAARSSSEPVVLAGLDGGPQMTMTTMAGSSQARLSSQVPYPIDVFERHLRAFQDLISFSADRPSVRLSLSAYTPEGQRVLMLRQEVSLTPQPIIPNAREAMLRFGSANFQNVVSEWWDFRRRYRPLTQVYTGAMYQPGYVESDIIALTSIAQRLGRLKLERPRASLRESLRALASGIDPDVLRLTGVDPAEWESHAIWARNDISHEGAPNDEAGVEYVTPAESKAVRDATHVILGLNLATMMGANLAALKLAARSLEVKYGIRHGLTTIFRYPE